MTQPQPPITGTTHTLPFDKLSPRDFERLCLWLVEREGYERAEHLGALLVLLKREHQYSNSTMARKIATFKNFFGWARKTYLSLPDTGQETRFLAVRIERNADFRAAVVAYANEKPGF